MLFVMFHIFPLATVLIGTVANGKNWRKSAAYVTGEYPAHSPFFMTQLTMFPLTNGSHAIPPEIGTGQENAIQPIIARSTGKFPLDRF
ncbi:hypothetical protein [Phyllobacterium myrsinacearum]|jgi:hypothetical protein|uniref:Uncharacterized protein n=1 Tax=Phyllobacterium myrsinacearum TaxID=28101 RepID=A0A2S9JP88_9HYPH|nr:hypothetical protein [Phyllobacterium myrsinacearum]PRD55058.1 hypothetical protein C5750_07650 [Phyllobacterium myrsinacearum]PWV90386.1 hypothetical protein DEV92_107110 [Phyllobacterium myrsinacearum]